MTMTAPVRISRTPKMSAGTRKFIGGNEVKIMTTATAPNRTVNGSAAGHYRTRGVDRAVERFAEGLLRWSRHRAARAAMGSAERSALLRDSEAQLRRELEAERLTLHFGL